MGNTNIVYDLIRQGQSIFQISFSLVLLAIIIISKWKLFVKANEPGWAAIIPFYNNYVLFKIAGKKILFWLYLILEILLLVCYVFMFITFIVLIGAGITGRATAGGWGNAAVLAIFIELGVLFLSAIGCFIIMAIISNSLARNFGKGIGFTLGLLFFPYVLYPIMAFDNGIVYLPNMQSYGQYGNQYGAQYGNQYGQMNGNQYGAQYGNQYGQMNGNQYGAQYGNQYGQMNGNQYGAQYGQMNGNQYGAQYGNYNQANGTQYGNYNQADENQYGNQYNQANGNQYGGQNVNQNNDLQQ